MTYDPPPDAFHVLWPLMTDEERRDFVRRAWDDARPRECIYVTDRPFRGWHGWYRMSNYAD
jgi:hypothetical protein